MAVIQRVLSRMGYERLDRFGLVLTPEQRILMLRPVVLDDGLGNKVVGWRDHDLAAMELEKWEPFGPAPQRAAATRVAVPARTMPMPIPVLVPVAPPVDLDDDEWEWTIALARARVAAEEAERAAAVLMSVPAPPPVKIDYQAPRPAPRAPVTVVTRTVPPPIPAPRERHVLPAIPRLVRAAEGTGPIKELPEL